MFNPAELEFRQSKWSPPRFIFAAICGLEARVRVGVVSTQRRRCCRKAFKVMEVLDVMYEMKLPCSVSGRHVAAAVCSDFDLNCVVDSRPRTSEQIYQRTTFRF